MLSSIDQSIAAALRIEGQLDVSAVRVADIYPLPSTGSSTILGIDVSALDSAGRELRLKLVGKPIGDDESEPHFYRSIAPVMPNCPVPRFLGIAETVDHGRLLLLEDLSGSHYKPDLDIPPTLPEVERMLQVLARLHGFWWSHSKLETLVGAPPTAELIEAAIAHVANCFPRFCDRLGDRLSQERREMCESLFDGRFATRLYERVTQGNLTLSHRDPHAWNFLVPTDPGGSAVLLDWNSHARLWRHWPGVSDIAYWIVHWWFPDRRRMLERKIIESYFQQIHATGVEFTLEQAWDDYRLFAMWSLMRPIEESLASPPWSWYPQFEYSVTAVEDLECRVIL